MRSFQRSASALLFAAGALSACHHKPAPAPEQVAATDMASFQTEVRKVVKDSARADSIIALTNEYLASLKATVAEIQAYRAQFAALARDYTTTPAQFDAALKARYAARDASLATLVALRQRMAALTTDEEWKELGKARVRELQATMQALEN